MHDRITRANLETRITNVNARMQARGSVYRYQVQERNGYTGLDCYKRDPDRTLNLPDSVPGRGAGWLMIRTLTVGTKREVGDYLSAMMNALDDATVTS